MSADFDITGEGVHDLGGAYNVAGLKVRLTTLSLDANIIDSNPPERISRVGWVAIGDLNGDPANPGVEGVYWRSWWLDFRNWAVDIEAIDYGARLIRWQLKYPAEGHIWVYF